MIETVSQTAYFRLVIVYNRSIQSNYKRERVTSTLMRHLGKKCYLTNAWRCRKRVTCQKRVILLVNLKFLYHLILSIQYLCLNQHEIANIVLLFWSKDAILLNDPFWQNKGFFADKEWQLGQTDALAKCRVEVTLIGRSKAFPILKLIQKWDWNNSPYAIGPRARFKSDATPRAATACDWVWATFKIAKIWSVRTSIRGSKRGIHSVLFFCSLMSISKWLADKVILK